MDVISYLMGKRKGVDEGTGRTVIDGDCTFSDDNSDGNIVIENNEEGE